MTGSWAPCPGHRCRLGIPQWQGDIKRNSSFFCRGYSLEECTQVANAEALFRWGKQALGPPAIRRCN